MFRHAVELNWVCRVGNRGWCLLRSEPALSNTDYPRIDPGRQRKPGRGCSQGGPPSSRADQSGAARTDLTTRHWVQYTSWMIEDCIKGKPFTVHVSPDTRTPVMYFKDAALSVVELARAPRESIKMVNYLVAGAKPVATAGELATVIKKRIPGAKIDFEPDMGMQKILNKLLHPIDDSVAQEEWGWEAEYGQEEIVDDFIAEMRTNSQRYS